MAQLTAHETIAHHIGALCKYLESVPGSLKGNAGELVSRYSVLVDQFWDVYCELAPAHHATYYWTFTKATGEEQIQAMAYYGADMWPAMASALAEKMKAQSVEVLHLLTEEAAVPEEYLSSLDLPR